MRFLVPGDVVEEVRLLGAAQHPGRPGALVEAHLALQEVRRPAEAGLDHVARVEVVGHDHRRRRRGWTRCRAERRSSSRTSASRDERGQPLRERVDRLELGVQLLAPERGAGALDRLGGEAGEAVEEARLVPGEGLDLEAVGHERAHDDVARAHRHRQQRARPSPGPGTRAAPTAAA